MRSDTDTARVLRLVHDLQGPDENASHETLLEVSDLPRDRVEDALETLLQGGVVFEPVLGEFRLTSFGTSHMERLRERAEDLQEDETDA